MKFNLWKAEFLRKPNWSTEIHIHIKGLTEETFSPSCIHEMQQCVKRALSLSKETNIHVKRPIKETLILSHIQMNSNLWNPTCLRPPNRSKKMYMYAKRLRKTPSFSLAYVRCVQIEPCIKQKRPSKETNGCAWHICRAWSTTARRSHTLYGSFSSRMMIAHAISYHVSKETYTKTKRGLQIL